MITRRGMLAGTAAAITTLFTKKAPAEVLEGSIATIIDIEKCNGCGECVTACRLSNKDRFPEPDEAMLKPYWPQKKFEDFSKKRDIIDRLTPYNWLFIQKVNVDGKIFNIPRRCMHCDNPPCVKLCPFGVMHKDNSSAVYIDTNLCFGGAKCRDVCPWNIPQRQAGVGLYAKFDPLPMGGGVMYKCDLCKDKLKAGKMPACFTSCKENAMIIDSRNNILQIIEAAKKSGKYIYGDVENGGTSTFYISSIPFEAIDEHVKESIRFNKVNNMLEENKSVASLALIAPVAGAVTAFAIASKVKKDGK